MLPPYRSTTNRMPPNLKEMTHRRENEVANGNEILAQPVLATITADLSPQATVTTTSLEASGLHQGSGRIASTSANGNTVDNGLLFAHNRLDNSCIIGSVGRMELQVHLHLPDGILTTKQPSVNGAETGSITLYPILRALLDSSEPKRAIEPAEPNDRIASPVGTSAKQVSSYMIPILAICTAAAVVLLASVYALI